jgi:hypothetical protein
MICLLQKTTNVRFSFQPEKAQKTERVAPGSLGFALLSGTRLSLSRTTVVVLQQTATIHVRQLRDDLLVGQTEVAIAAE